MKTKTIILTLVVLVIVGANILVYKYFDDQKHVNDRPLMEFMNYIVANHPTCFDERYANIANWEMTTPNNPIDFKIVNTSGLPEAEIELLSNPNGLFGHLEANATCGMFVWDGIFFSSNNTVKELIYTITG